jgi:tetratricopeptide (TPR) repeat protein
MRRIPVRSVVLALAAVQLGGCNSFLGINFARNASPPKEADTAVAVASPITERGRSQLADGQSGLAVETFKQALAAGEPQAPAINGLGVAFARLGRFDLAHRFFWQAAALAPADTRYSDNLARMMRSPELLAMRRDADIAAAAQARHAANLAEAEAKLAAKPEVGKIERLSRGSTDRHCSTAGSAIRQGRPERLGPRLQTADPRRLR